MSLANDHYYGHVHRYTQRELVGLFADFREVFVPTGHGLSYFGVAQVLQRQVRLQRWRRPPLPHGQRAQMGRAAGPVA